MSQTPYVPLSLLEWRELEIGKFRSIDPWVLLQSWFEENGLILFDAIGHARARVPGRVERAPELGVYTVTGPEILIKMSYQHEVSARAD